MEKFKKRFQGFRKWFSGFLIKYNEYLPLLVAIPIWWASGYVTRWIDPQAGVDDAGLFQALIFGLVLYFAAQACAWFSMRMAFPTIGEFIDKYIAGVFITKISDRQRMWIAVVLFALHFMGAVIIFSLVI